MKPGHDHLWTAREDNTLCCSVCGSIYSGFGQVEGRGSLYECFLSYLLEPQVTGTTQTHQVHTHPETDDERFAREADQEVEDFLAHRLV